jgi:hypothetical protein
MVVQEELRIATAWDIPVYAAGHRVQRTVREVILAAQEHRSDAVHDLWTCATTLTAVVAMALRAADTETELLRWRQAELVIHVLRADAYQMLREKALAPAMFDELSHAVNHCRSEVLSSLRHATRRAWAQVQGATRASRPLLARAADASTRDAEITAQVSAVRRRRTLTLP